MSLARPVRFSSLRTYGKGPLGRSLGLLIWPWVCWLWLASHILGQAPPSAAPAAKAEGEPADRAGQVQRVDLAVPALRALPMMALRAARTSRLPQLSELTMVKLDQHAGKWQLVMMLESFRSEVREGRAVQFREEQRTRTVLVDGKQVEQSYTVKVPVAVNGEYEVKTPAGRKPVMKPADQFRFLDLAGQELSLQQASERLQTLQAAFLLDRFIGELPPVPEVYRQALHETCLIIVCEDAVRELGDRVLEGEVLPARQFDLPARPQPR